MPAMKIVRYFMCECCNKIGRLFIIPEPGTPHWVDCTSPPRWTSYWGNINNTNCLLKYFNENVLYLAIIASLFMVVISHSFLVLELDEKRGWTKSVYLVINYLLSMKFCFHAVILCNRLRNSHITWLMIIDNCTDILTNICRRLQIITGWFLKNL